MKLGLTSLALALAVSFPLAAEYPPDWTRAIAPARIVGNIHYVGTADLGAYLIAGNEGLVLLDVPLAENVPLILENIRTLGFDPADIRILLNSHAHFDHAGGIADVKKQTGAKVYLTAADAELAARGGRDDFAFEDRVPYAPFKADAIVSDEDVVRLGNVAMTALLTPGHTKGCTTWKTTAVENGEELDVVFLCSVTAPGYQLVKNPKYPTIFDDYRASFARLADVDADVFLANHGSFFGLTGKLSAMEEGKPNPFIDRSAFHAYLDRAWRDLQAQKERQEKAGE